MTSIESIRVNEDTGGSRVKRKDNNVRVRVCETTVSSN